MIELLPSEIKVDIFSQLSVDSILQCKLICKTWRIIINELLKDSFFLDIQTRRMLSSSSPTPPAAAAASYSFLTREKFFKDNDWSIIGSCNGLVCLVRKSSYLRLHACICNPVTKEYMNLPLQFNSSKNMGLLQFNSSPSRRNMGLLQFNSSPSRKNMGLFSYDIVAVGFGYLPCTKEYKFVRITDDTKTRYISVYTLGSGTWRIKKVHHPFYVQLRFYDNKSETAPATGLLYSGALYWNAHHRNHSIIISFDLEKEEFRIVPLPTRLLENTDEIGVLGGRFCVIRTKVIWVMNKEEENYTWTEEFGRKNINIITPFTLEELIFSNYDYMKFASCDHPRTRSHHLDDHHLSRKHINPQVVDWFEILQPFMSRFQMIPYMRSLVSLKGLGEKDVDVATRKRKRDQ